MNRYSYEGPVYEFDRCINSNWKGSTYAVSEPKARSNLIYQCKRAHGKSAVSKLSLPGKIKLIEKE